jgi:guanine nucleotide-binding protein G(i) subunit alpha
VEEVIASAHLKDSIGYFYRRREAVLAEDWVPTDNDILYARAKTTGITETTFAIGGTTYRMVDVGGQRSERKKWIHCFENVTAILFLAALSEYDEKLVEDEKVNRMQEALTLFDSIANSRWFKRRTAIILFLNKIDIFRDKIETVPIRDYFPDYTGGDDYENGTAYFGGRFRGVLQDQERRPVYTHLTCATDTQQIRFVMQAVRDIIRKESLRGSEIE